MEGILREKGVGFLRVEELEWCSKVGGVNGGVRGEVE